MTANLWRSRVCLPRVPRFAGKRVSAEFSTAALGEHNWGPRRRSVDIEEQVFEKTIWPCIWGTPSNKMTKSKEYLLTQAVSGDLAVAFFEFAANCFAANVSCRSENGSRAHERIEYRVARIAKQ